MDQKTHHLGVSKHTFDRADYELQSSLSRMSKWTAQFYQTDRHAEQHLIQVHH